MCFFSKSGRETNLYNFHKNSLVVMEDNVNQRSDTIFCVKKIEFIQTWKKNEQGGCLGTTCRAYMTLTFDLP